LSTTFQTSPRLLFTSESVGAFGTEEVAPEVIQRAILETFHLRPAAIVAALGLRRAVEVAERHAVIV
jgi:S-adenosylmethionine synthetase